MVVVMLAAEEPLASTPRRGMDCVGKANTSKKLVQARLPFKRLNPETKECGEPKRTKGPVVPKCSETSVSDGENDGDSSSTPLHRGPALVNGRGPLDCFMSRRKHSPVCSGPETIDLTEDSNDAVKQQPAPPVAATCPLSEETTKDAEHATKSCAATCPLSEETTKNAEHPTKSTEPTTPLTKKETEKDEDALPLLDIAQESDTEEEEQQETEVSHGNESELSTESTSSLSVVESSPEPSKSAPTTPASTSQINAASKMKRRSLKSVQEQEEKQRQKEEKERQKKEAKAAKERKKKEARKLKEEKEREKKEKKEKDEKERREKKEREEKEKAEKLRAKEDQRQMKIEAKLGEKRKKEEEKRLKEEKDRIKAEKAEITRFLQKPKTQLAPKTLASACGKFAPFEIKANMSLAPLTRVQYEDSVLEELDRYLAQPDSTLNGLKDWTRHKPRRSGPTQPSHSAVRDCVVITDSQKADGIPDRHRYGRMKLLQFHDNYRPAYWGTWCKKSTRISPRCPLRQDKGLLDYEVDSDEEWEEEEPGESLSHSEGDDDDEGGDDDDDDDGFFVPHGYLSEGEGALEEDEEGGDPEKQKVRQRMKAREWENELMSKGKVKVLESVVRGCLWEGEEPGLDLLQPYAICILEPLPRDEPCTPEQDLSRQQRNEKLLSQLLPLLHGNVNSSKVIINEFLEFCRQQTSSPTESPQNCNDNVPPRIQIRRIIKEHAVYEKRSTYRRCCWYVHPEVLARHSQEALPVPCQWTYLTSGAQIPRDEHAGSQGNSPTTSCSTTPSSKRKSASSHSITKYMKKCGDSEQTETMETDGFQADTEDDEDDDCIIIGEQSGSSEQDANTSLRQTKRNTEPMDTNASETAALALPCLTPATA
ncbi:chromatin assembly factor 1 subunit A-like isoform X2 [Sinocyclocheilus rhinocerous]|uniref:chromatin assembly factor 1 subunit A-like isoform X2 n=1 Tax=Sinocyclocheilus rhinocerous TaxID=307959 RepID=UPI0007B91F6B|nr:PREDICTED: chromatin assembly factor 1 subunit A-like isoform X2 [Sinocyclocheilus rhinocerous]